MESGKPANIFLAPILFLFEYLFKFLAGVGAAIVIAAEGSFIGKIGAGFSSLWPALQRLFNAPDNLTYLGQVVEDYNTLTAAAFNQQYGGQAINNLLEQLNHAVAYFQAIYQNLVEQPVVTLLATLLTFTVLYLLGRTTRFVRQRGRGSYIDRVERKLGQKVFDQPAVKTDSPLNGSKLKHKADV